MNPCLLLEPLFFFVSGTGHSPVPPVFVMILSLLFVLCVLSHPFHFLGCQPCLPIKSHGSLRPVVLAQAVSPASLAILARLQSTPCLSWASALSSLRHRISHYSRLAFIPPPHWAKSDQLTQIALQCQVLPDDYQFAFPQRSANFLLNTQSQHNAFCIVPSFTAFWYHVLQLFVLSCHK